MYFYAERHLNVIFDFMVWSDQIFIITNAHCSENFKAKAENSRSLMASIVTNKCNHSKNERCHLDKKKERMHEQRWRGLPHISGAYLWPSVGHTTIIMWPSVVAWWSSLVANNTSLIIRYFIWSCIQISFVIDSNIMFYWNTENCKAKPTDCSLCEQNWPKAILFFCKILARTELSFVKSHH